jgi:hypothetical protein
MPDSGFGVAEIPGGVEAVHDFLDEMGQFLPEVGHWSFHTNWVEGANRSRTLQTDKRFDYYVSFPLRNAVSLLLRIFGPDYLPIVEEALQIPALCRWTASNREVRQAAVMRRRA